ncbi:SRPBCC family protein [Cohnella thailandensis]|uniref:SRPBCC domain-containing protein n=1 Tax=Cohnella thailandensis TaxID=557557 RepID=A0A841STV5_9BACL|nr:SRPBCC domain-containing protein [Cohnella thailandensis]MBB6635753.1 SRPBCC domain-containing protein [Cohnella thailandensis]MBP1976131.1 uncharacterized protein YndB with AHSA1/START domain [Cohnella thailandensis]
MNKHGRQVGQTAATGFQIGVRRTLPISAEAAWAYLVSPEGLELWLGNVPNLSIREGEAFGSPEGISGELRVVKPESQLRLRWKKNGWEKPSTLQIRLLPGKAGQTTISFHQENLDHPNTRELMKMRWESVLNEIRHRTSSANNHAEERINP